MKSHQDEATKRSAVRADRPYSLSLPAAQASTDLINRVELAVLAGRDLGEIEAEILAGSDLDEETLAAACLYAWSRQRAVRSSVLRSSHPVHGNIRSAPL